MRLGSILIKRLNAKLFVKFINVKLCIIKQIMLRHVETELVWKHDNEKQNKKGNSNFLSRISHFYARNSEFLSKYGLCF